MKAKKLLSIMTAVSIMCANVYADSTIVNENGVTVRDSVFNEFSKTIVDENIIKDIPDTKDKRADNTAPVADNKQEEPLHEDFSKDVHAENNGEDVTVKDDAAENNPKETVSQPESPQTAETQTDDGTNNTIINNNQIYMENVVANEISITIINYNQINDQPSEEENKTPEIKTEEYSEERSDELSEKETAEEIEKETEKETEDETEKETAKRATDDQKSSRRSGGGGRSSSLNKVSKTETSTETTTTAVVTASYTAKPQERAQYKFQIDTRGFWAGKTFREADTAPYISNGRTMLPLRLTGEVLGFNVSYDAESKTACLTNGQKVLYFTVGSDLYTVDGQNMIGTGRAEVKDSRIFLPLRDVSNALGMEIVWNQSERTAVVTV